MNFYAYELPASCKHCGSSINSNAAHVNGTCVHCIVDSEADRIVLHFKRARYHERRGNLACAADELQRADNILDEGLIDGDRCAELQAELDHLRDEIITKRV